MTEENFEFLNQIREFLESRRYGQLHRMLLDINSVDISELMEELNEKEKTIVFRMLAKDKAADVFSYMKKDDQLELIKNFSEKEICEIINNMYADDSVDFLSDMPSNFVSRLLKSVDSNTRNDINLLLQYKQDSVGSIMTVEYISFKPNITINQALEKIKKEGIDSETIYTCYVTENRKLLGIVSAKDLIINDSEKLISDILIDSFISIHTDDDKETAAKLFRKYGLIAIPVVDSEFCLVGIVTFDDAIDVLMDETTEDIQKMAGLTSYENDYLDKSVWDHAKHRIAWLLFLMFSATITGTIITKYENAFAIVPLLVSFIPMLMDTGGNCGAQSSTLIIRGITIDEIQFRDMFKVLWKEFRVSLIVGLGLAIANGVRILIMYKDIKLATVVCLSLIGTIVVSKLIGAALPLLANKVKLDPAIMAAPLITTIVDTFSIIIYFQIATLVFKL